MVRSLYSGISGLRNHQTSMDVTGNNIANVNTTGFKTGRVTFEESMAQLLKGASRPPGNAGGTNPMQLGLGMSIGSIDTLLTQGNLQSTGKITDLAIEGRAYFAYSSGEGTWYSRNGALQMDSQGRLVSPTNGFSLQGIMADNDGNYPVGSSIDDIIIPFGSKAPAKATTEVGYASNLDSDSEGLGTVLHTNRFLAASRTTDYLVDLYDANGSSLGVRAGDVITIRADGAASSEETFTVEETTTLADLISSLNTVVQAASGDITVNATLSDGQVQITTQPTMASAINNLQITSSRPGSNSFVSNAFSFPPSMQYDAADPTETTGMLFRPAEETDELGDVYDASGQTLGLETGDTITINGSVGGRTRPPVQLTYTDGGTGYPDNVNTLSDVVRQIRDAFSLPETDGTYLQNQSVELNNPSTPDDLIPDGSIVIRGQPEEAFALTNVSVTADNADNDATAPTRFVANSAMTEIQEARDTGQHSTSIVVYDESGDAHTMTTTFTHSGQPNEWLWEITMNAGEEILGGNTGRITFGQDGSPSSFTFDDNSTSFRFDPMNGSNEVVMQLDIGSPGSFEGITQFRSPSTTAAREQDGYPMGKLQEISINEYGDVDGIYTNGVSKSIARIYIAEFNNPAGLLKRGDSMFGVSNNSGEAVMLRPGIGSSSKIKPGALEMSNVELSTEFTNMITTQRGFQANARVITTSDQMLQELVQLIR